jgi:hypothetical protein
LLKIFFSFQAAIEHAFHPTALPALLAQIVLFVSSREMRLCGTSLFPSTPFITFFDFYFFTLQIYQAPATYGGRDFQGVNFRLNFYNSNLSTRLENKINEAK